MKGMADTEPEPIVGGQGKTQFNYNIKQVEIEDTEGNPKSVYEYNYVEIEGKITKAKIIQALEDSKLDIDEDYESSVLEAEYNKAKEVIQLSAITSLTYAQLETYINTHVTNLTEAKEYLKKLSKVVLAILKYHNVG